MRPSAPGAGHVAAGLVLSSTVDVWFAGEVTAMSVPVASGRLVAQRDQEVPEHLTVTVPLEHEGMSLDPDAKGAVLGKDGHELVVTVHIESATGRRWTVPAGRFQVQSWRREGAGVAVVAHGLLRKVKSHLRASPRSPGSVSPIAGELMREFGDVGFTTRPHPDLPTRSVPRDFVFGTDRLASINELVSAWPARMRVDVHGVVEFLPPLTDDPGVPVAHLHDGVDGTITGAPSEGDRDGVHNHVIVHVKPEGDAPEWSHDEWVKAGRLNVETYGWASRPPIESDAITSVAQAQSVAWQELELSKARARTIPVEGVPDWRLEVDDTVRVTTHEGVDVTGRLTGVDLPLTSFDGAMRVDVGVID